MAKKDTVNAIRFLFKNPDQMRSPWDGYMLFKPYNFNPLQFKPITISSDVKGMFLALLFQQPVSTWRASPITKFKLTEV